MGFEAVPLTKLYDLLNTEIDGYYELIELTKLEQQALLEENFEDLWKIVDQKEKLVTTILRHDQDREKMASSLASSLNLVNTASLTEIVACLGKKAQEKFEEIQAILLPLIEEFLVLNHANYLLIQSGLSFVEATIDHIVSINTSLDGRYTVKGVGSSLTQSVNHIVNWIA